jgi:hypothetical protein
MKGRLHVGLSDRLKVGRLGHFLLHKHEAPKLVHHWVKYDPHINFGTELAVRLIGEAKAEFERKLTSGRPIPKSPAMKISQTQAGLLGRLRLDR